MPVLKPLFQITVKESMRYFKNWEFGWGHSDEAYEFVNINDILPFQKGTIVNWVINQYGKVICNKVKMVISRYDLSRRFANVTKPIADKIEGILVDSSFNPNNMRVYSRFCNDIDLWGNLPIREEHEYVKRHKYGRPIVYTYYPRCKKPSLLNSGILTHNLHDLLVDMESPDNGRSGLYLGIGPMPSLPSKDSASEYSVYKFAYAVDYYITFTFSGRNFEDKI